MRRFALFNYGNFWYKDLRKDKNKMEKKEETYRRALVQVIRFLDSNKHSNTKTRRIVDMVLNHDATFDRAVFVADREAEVLENFKRRLDGKTA